jgi:hypothetical protein
MEFLIYKKFQDQELAEAFAQLLVENQVEFEITEDRGSLGAMYGDSESNRQIFVKIKKDDFSKVDAILLQEGEKNLETVDKDHYLYEFTDEELFEVLSKRDEWNEFDFQLSRKILKERGKDISDDTIELLRKQRVVELGKPEEGSKAWIYAGYVLCLMGGLIGIFMGLALVTAKKTLPNGEKMYAYSEAYRKHGTRLIIIGSTMFLITFIVRALTADYYQDFF